MESTETPKSPLVPYLCVKGAEQAISFYWDVFGATELDRYQDEPGGKIGHVTLDIYGGLMFLSDEFPEIGVLSPETVGGTSVGLHLTVPDVDAVTQRAVELGAKLVRAPADQSYGERNSKFTDPFGHSWMVGTKR